MNASDALSISCAAPASAESRHVGNYICDRMEKVAMTAVALHRVAKFTVNHGGHFVCAAASIVTGLTNLYNGAYFSGGALTAIGMREAYNLLSTSKTDVQRLLQDASAGVDMIKTLEQANQSSFDNININLDQVDHHIKELESRLHHIQHVATQGSKKLHKQKEKTLVLFEEASILFKQSQSVLNLSKSQIQKASHQFDDALLDISELIELAQEQEGDFQEKTKRFSELAQQIYEACTQAKETLEKGNQSLTVGLDLLNQALTKYQGARFEEGKTVEMAAAKLKKIALKAEVKENCQHQIDSVKKELSDVRARNEAILQIADEVQSDIEDADRAAAMQFGYQSLILGGGTGALIGGAFSGGTAAGAGAVAGTVAYHHRKSIGNALFGKDPEPIPPVPTLHAPVTYSFNPRSSGFWGRYYEKRGSFTKGKISLYLGQEETFSLNFDLNAKHKVSKKELKELYQGLSSKLDENPEYSISCLDLLNRLATIQIERGGKHKASVGFIAENDPYFVDLKRRAIANVGLSTGH